MKKSLLCIASFFLGAGAFAQEVITSQGESYSNANGYIDFTIGEAVIDTGTDGSNDITQGFHQTNWNFAGLEDHQPSVQALIYPNPTQESLVIQIDMFEGVVYQMTDAAGRIVRESQLFNEETQLNVSDLAPGNYLVILSSSGVPMKTFKLIKNQ